MSINRCNQCGYVWTPRVSGVVVACPKCKRYDWNEEKKGGEPVVVDGVRVKRVYRKRVDSGRVAQLAEHSAHNRQVVGSTPTEPTKICRSCEGEMIQVRGFWACPELTCSLCGQQQGRVN